MSKTVKLGIIGAMESEIDLLVSKMNDTETEKIGRHTFFVGKLGQTSVVVARAGVGKVNAAACTTAMILTYLPECIVNIGVAGGLSPALMIGDVVIADNVVEYDLDYGSLGDVRGTIFYPDGSEEREMPGTSEIRHELFLASKRVHVATAQSFSTFIGTVATGDRFVSSDEARADILSVCPNAVCCEMEGGAIAHVCRLYDVPFAVLRSISDGANSSSEIDFSTFVRVAADQASRIIEEFAKTLDE